MPMLRVFLAGADTFGFLVASLLFLRAWTRTLDVLFAVFSGAFVLLAIDQFAGAFEHARGLESTPVYLLRFAAFALLIAAVFHKNVGAARRD